MRIIFSLIVIGITNSAKYFISKSGINNPACGNQQNPCMSLYYVSTLITLLSINSTNEDYIINIIDGQNYTTNSQTNTTVYNPCLPIPFKLSNDITINFNKTNIRDFHDWYPPTCDNITGYNNSYMFDGGKSLTINNLVINNHNILPFIHSVKIQCNDCIFMNIIASNLKIIHAENTSSTSPMIILQNTQFVNVTNVIHKGSIIGVDNSLFDQASKIIINKCKFLNVSTLAYGGIFSDDANGEVNITNTEFYMTGGSIYLSYHQFESHVNIYNVSIISTESEYWFQLLEFPAADVIDIHQIHIKYLYNASAECQSQSHIMNQLINKSCVLFHCINPQELIWNAGEIRIDSMSIDLDIYRTTDTISQLECTQFQYEEGYYKYLIGNVGKMIMKNIYVKKTISTRLIQNEGTLHIFNLSFDPTINDIYMYDPYELHSTRIVYQSGDRSADVVIEQSSFVGSYWQIEVETGTAKVSNCIFSDGFVAVQANYVNSLEIVDNVMFTMGFYYGLWVPADIEYGWPVMMINECDDVIVENNNISGYSVDGLLSIIRSENILLIENVFNIDTNNFYYDDVLNWEDISIDRNPLWLYQNNNSRIIGNYFLENEFSNISWMGLYDNDGINCLYGNVFRNKAIYLKSTHCTSCLRPGMIYCIDYGLKNCSLDIYGKIDESVIDYVGYFIVSTDDDIIYVENGKIVMDDINIISNTHSTKIVGNQSDILFVDSYIHVNDILYHHDTCNIMYNDRLLNHSQYISQLAIHCGDLSEQSLSIWSKTLDSNITRYVKNLSPLKIDFMPEASYYYPGQLLKFNYTIMDKIGTVIPYDAAIMSQELKIRLSRSGYLTELTIHSDGKCLSCDTGMLFSFISISRDNGDSLIMDLYIMGNILYPILNKISLNITGCPQGRGPDINNDTCNQCDPDYYNLSPNNIAKCKTCNPEKNKGIECMEGDIFVYENYWMDINDDAIISSICPSQYCVTKYKCSYSKEKEYLCALNRDYKSKLCGKCKNKYSESVNSTKCVKCKDGHNLQYLLFPITLSLVLSVILIITNAKKLKKKKKSATRNEIPKICQVLQSEYFKSMVIIMIFKNIMYYEQGISQILLSAPMPIF
eukprot:274480_1